MKVLSEIERLNCIYNWLILMLIVNMYLFQGKMATRSTSLNGFVGGGGAKDSNVPISHLDYSYISKCDNAKELEEIIKVLRYICIIYNII